jgi:hypothetical protein
MLIDAIGIIAALMAIYIFGAAYLLLAAAWRSPAARSATPPPLLFALVIPALNEELVIANTIRHLLSLPGDNYMILVMNDASDDGTAKVVAGFAGQPVRLITRHAPHARLGKGAVLNHAYQAILASELPDLYGADNVIMVVMDADGQVPRDLLAYAAPYFADPNTGAVQVAVRMLNAHENLVTRWQHLEFVMFNALCSRARERLGSVSLGGNGQFVRLSALQSLGHAPWTDCLTEDLDIGLRLLLAGWRNHYCHSTHVAQQAVTELGRLVRQRARWFQGHLSCWKHIPALLGSKLPPVCKLDILNYLLAPGIMPLLGTVSLASLAYVAVTLPLLIAGGRAGQAGPLDGLVWYALALGWVPCLILALRGEKGLRLHQAVWWAHFVSLGSYIWFWAALTAVRNLALRHTGWLKTARTAIRQEAGSRTTDTEGPTLALREYGFGAGIEWGGAGACLLPLRMDNFLPRGARLRLATALGPPYAPPPGWPARP